MNKRQDKAYCEGFLKAWNTLAGTRKTCNFHDHVSDCAWCSECKAPIKFPAHPNYCPNCGAKVVE